ncbi:signal peptidase 22kDa subunit [Paraphysoderma sedebokerense]|nr:signal peptidase 22kDa subunit [Paraphysoderma sedebokerense]
MYSIHHRLNGVFAFSTTVLFFLAGAIALSSFLLPRIPTIPPKITINSLNVYPYSQQQAWRVLDYHMRSAHHGFLDFNLDADFESVFHWNVKQIFVSIILEIEDPDNQKINQVVVWDSIVRKTNKKLNIHGSNKYGMTELKDTKNGLFGRKGKLKIWYSLMPNVGLMLDQNVEKIVDITFPKKFSEAQEQRYY